MTEPGYVAPLAPGWWVRTGRIGINANGYDWTVSAVGNSHPGGTGSGAYNWAGTANGQAPVTFDSLGAGNSVQDAASLTWSHTGTAGATAIAWAVYANNSNTLGMTATYNGNAMTHRGSTLAMGLASNGFFYFIDCFSYLTTSSGAQSIVLTPTANSYMKGNSLYYKNVQTFGTPVTNSSASGTSLSVSSVPSNAGHMVSSVLTSPLGATAALTSYNQTSRWNIDTGAWAPVATLLGDAPGAATVSFSATANTTGIWGAMAIDLS